MNANLFGLGLQLGVLRERAGAALFMQSWRGGEVKALNDWEIGYLPVTTDFLLFLRKTPRLTRLQGREKTMVFRG